MLAYAGGAYRFLSESDVLGLTQHSSKGISADANGSSSVISVREGEYLNQMEVDAKGLVAMLGAEKGEMLALSKVQAEKLGLVNNGQKRAEWAIEQLSGITYLKGEQHTSIASGKVLFRCAAAGKLEFTPMYLAGTNSQKILTLSTQQSMRIDDRFLRLPSPAIKPHFKDGYIIAGYRLSKDLVVELLRADSIGFALSGRYPNIFWGFSVDTKPNRKNVRSYFEKCLRNEGREKVLS